MGNVVLSIKQKENKKIKEKKRVRHEHTRNSDHRRVVEGYPSTISSYFHAWPLMLYYVATVAEKRKQK
jgi:hypothetical protein